LYKLTKQIGKFIQNARTFSTDLTTTFESNMESQLQLEELRKAQRELNDAFNFRRSINVDEDADAFATNVNSPREGLREGIDPAEAAAGEEAGAAAAAGAAAVAAGGTTKKKKIRRRIKKRALVEEDVPIEANVPDLEMPSPPVAAASSIDQEQKAEETYTAEELQQINSEFEQYVGTSTEEGASPSWATADDDGAEAAAAQQQTARFQQQMSGNWNEQILANEEKLEPLARVMEKLALLEEEKAAATRRLEEEYAKRAELEETYYRRQREVLEAAAAEVQADAYVGGGTGAGDVNSSKP